VLYYAPRYIIIYNYLELARISVKEEAILIFAIYKKNLNGMTYYVRRKEERWPAILSWLRPPVEPRDNATIIRLIPLYTFFN
jgi:hypothetical protein